MGANVDWDESWLVVPNQSAHLRSCQLISACRGRWLFGEQNCKHQTQIVANILLISYKVCVRLCVSVCGEGSPRPAWAQERERGTCEFTLSCVVLELLSVPDLRVFGWAHLRRCQAQLEALAAEIHLQTDPIRLVWKPRRGVSSPSSGPLLFDNEDTEKMEPPDYAPYAIGKI